MPGYSREFLELRFDAERDPQGTLLQRALDVHGECERSRHWLLFALRAIAAVSALLGVAWCFPPLISLQAQWGAEVLLISLLIGLVKLGIQERCQRRELAQLASLLASSAHAGR